MSRNSTNFEDTPVSESLSHLLNISRSHFYIIHHIEYWFKRKPDGFYKFSEPCNHRLYREGDSWSEALGIHRKTFNRFFDLIGVRYKSKSAFLSSKNKFQGKLYASYYHRLEKKTFYVRNDSLANDFMLLLKFKNHQHSKKNSPLPNGKNVRSNIDINISIQEITPRTSHPESQEITRHKEIGGRLIDIWNDLVNQGVEKIRITENLKKNLQRTFKCAFNSEMKQWEDYCRKISHNRFLMGGGERGWKANLDWAIKPDNIQKVQSGYYTGQKEESYAAEIMPLKIEEIEELQGEGTWQEILRRLARRIGLHTFKSWFTGLKAIDLGATHLRLKTSSNFKKDRIRSHYYHDLVSAIQSVLPNVQGVDLLA